MKKLIVILIAMMLFASSCALAEGTLTAQGVGVVMVDADHAAVTLGVQELAEDVQAGQASVNEKIDAVIAAIREIGISDASISTSGLGMYANYAYTDDGQEYISGYNVYNTLRIELNDVDSVGAVIDAAFAAGANSLDYVEFTATDTKDAANEALAMAIDRAKERAATLAAAAGVELGDILEVRDSADTAYQVDSNMIARVEDAGAGTQALPSRQQVRAEVTLVYAIK